MFLRSISNALSERLEEPRRCGCCHRGEKWPEKSESSRIGGLFKGVPHETEAPGRGTRNPVKGVLTPPGGRVVALMTIKRRYRGGIAVFRCFSSASFALLRETFLVPRIRFSKSGISVAL